MTITKWDSVLLNLGTYWGVDIGSDHHFLISSLHLYLKKRKQSGKLTEHYAVEKLRDLAIAKQYKIELKNHFQLLQN